MSDGWARKPENGECQMSAISAVLPLKAYGRRYIDDPGRCHILLTSLATFAPDDMFEDIFVVVPARERAHSDRRSLGDCDGAVLDRAIAGISTKWSSGSRASRCICGVPSTTRARSSRSWSNVVETGLRRQADAQVAP